MLPNWGFTGGDLLPTLTMIIGMTAGTMLGVWLGQLITEQGIGNGVSLIIFAGIVANIPYQIAACCAQQPADAGHLPASSRLIMIGVIVWVQEGQRRIPVQYGKRVRTMRGNRMMMVGGQSTYVPLRVNTAGMIPLIFAQSLLILPSTLASYFVARTDWTGHDRELRSTPFFSPQNCVYWLLYFLLTVAFTYFYTDVMFRQQNLPETLQKQGGFIPGIRPGPRTESYLNGVLQRITLVGALFLGFIAVLPFVVSSIAQLLFGADAALADGLQLADHQQHRLADRGRCGAGHDEADRSAVDDAQLRRLYPLTIDSVDECTPTSIGQQTHRRDSISRSPDRSTV